MGFNLPGKSMHSGTSAHSSALKMKKESMAKMAKNSPMDKALVGNQKNLPEHLKAKIEAAPSKMKKEVSPAKHKKDGKYTGHNHKGMKLFERVTGKKFVDTRLGKSIAGKKKEVVTKTIDKKLEKKDETNVPATNLKVHKSSSGSGDTKPASRKPESYTVVGNPNETFVRGGGDPYQYQTKDGGQTFQYKKIGESKWNDVRGGNDKISSAYAASKDQKK